MSDEWLTYEEVAERLHVTVRAARARAFRGRWSKTQGNDGRARVRLPDEAPNPPRLTTVRPTESAIVTALRDHNDTLKGGAQGAAIARRREASDRRRRSGGRVGADLGGDLRVCRAGGSARPVGGRAGAALVAAAGRIATG
jgi:hypothetical protein